MSDRCGCGDPARVWCRDGHESCVACALNEACWACREEVGARRTAELFIAWVLIGLLVALVFAGMVWL